MPDKQNDVDMKVRARGIWSVTVFTLVYLSLGMLMGLGSLNEIVAFIASQTMDTNVGGYVNTGGDLVANGIGALIAILLISVKARKAQ